MHTIFKQIFLGVAFLLNISPLYSQENVFDKKDLIILDEVNTIRVNGSHREHQFFTIVKKITYKIVSEEGARKLSNYTIPTTFDGTNIVHAPTERNITQNFFIDRVNYFRGYKYTNSKDKKAIKSERSIEKFRAVSPITDRYITFKDYIYSMEGLKMGDILELAYSYDLDYTTNFHKLSSFRIFFNDTIFKEKYSLKIIHQKNENIVLELYNSSIKKETVKEKNNNITSWQTTNLRGCIKEEGARPYLSVPYVGFTFKTDELMLSYVGANSSVERVFIPFSLYTSYRETSYFNIASAVINRKITLQYFKLNKFVTTTLKEMYADSLDAYKLLNLEDYPEKELENDYFDKNEAIKAREEEFLATKTIDSIVPENKLDMVHLIRMHHKIVDRFSYQSDEGYFDLMDNRKFKFGENLVDSTFRDLNRYSTYVALITRVGLTFCNIYTADSRSGIIDERYFSTIHYDDNIFGVVQKNNKLRYIYPKKARFGYYIDELPFYIEGNSAIVKKHIRYGTGKARITTSFGGMRLPSSSLNDNTRNTHVKVIVNLSSNIVHFDARINLKGQYSTLTRGLYQYNYKDETVNELYYQKIWDLNNAVRLDSLNVRVADKEFPYPTIISAKYTANNLIEKEGDTLSLNLKNWFAHVISPNVDAQTRQLDFYSDFYGKDVYVYFILFDQPIKLIGALLDVTTKNDLGNLLIKTEQLNPKTVKITSHFVTKSNKVFVEDIESVTTIFDEIKELNSSRLLFTIREE